MKKSKIKITEEEKEKFKETLKEILEKGNFKVFQVITWVGKTGMTRTIKNFVACGSGEVIGIDYYISALLDEYLTADGVYIKGCGMDMAADLVYRLSLLLYNDGYKLKSCRIY